MPVDPTAEETQWICSSCQTLTSQDDVEQWEEEEVEQFNKLKKGDLTQYYTFMNKLGDRFHSSHHLVMRLAQFLVLLQVKKLYSNNEY